jgi:hypothetical protein
MARKKAATPEAPKPNDLWQIKTEMQINGRNVSKGTELKVKGQRGRFRFIKHVVTETGHEWIDAIGGPKGAEQWRSFHLEDVKTVHVKNQTVTNLAKEYKQKQKDKKNGL